MTSTVGHARTARLTTVSIVLLVAVASGIGTAVLGPAQVAVIAVLLLTIPIVIDGWPLSGIFLIVVSTALNRYRFDIAGWGLKLEYVAIAYVFIMWLFRSLTSRSRIQIDTKEWVLVAWLLINLLSSFINAPDWNHSLKLCVLLGLLVMMYLMAVRLLSNENVLQRAVVLFLVVGTATSLFGILARWLYPLGINLGVDIDPFTAYLLPHGTLWESNIFGSYAMSFALCFLSLLTTSTMQRKHQVLLLGGLTVTCVASALSLSRGAFVGFGGGLVLMFLMARKSPLLLWVLAIAMTGLLVLLLSVGIGVDENQSPIIARLSNLSHLTTLQSWQGRLYYYRLAIDSWRSRPLLGWGTGSFGQLYSYTTIDMPAWVPNLEIRVLHDSGLIGLCAFVLFLVMVIGDAMRAVARAKTGFDRTLLIAFLASLMGLLIAYQATDATWLGFTWVHIAFLVAATRIVLKKNPIAVTVQGMLKLDGR